MKQFVCSIWAVCSFVSLLAQAPSLPLSTAKTTSLIFPFPVKHVDRGSKEVIVQQVTAAENILLVKAAASNFCETNLSVITSDGSLYTFDVCYDPAPAVWVYQLPVQKQASPAMYAAAILDNPPLIKNVHQRRWDLCFGLQGIYVRGEILYYQLRLKNESALDYTLDALRFSIRDKKQAKRTAVQERELSPLLVAGSASLVKAHEETTIVVALQTHTLANKKILCVEATETGGGRSLSLTVKNKFILHATPLPDLK